MAILIKMIDRIFYKIWLIIRPTCESTIIGREYKSLWAAFRNLGIVQEVEERSRIVARERLSLKLRAYKERRQDTIKARREDRFVNQS